MRQKPMPPAVTSPWTAVDGLIHELGILRAKASGLKARRLDADFVDRIEKLIASAAAAVDATIDGPEDDELLILACEAVIVARDGIESCNTSPPSPSQATAAVSELRRRAAQLRSRIETSDHA
ncbi:MAG TPA: hypothetical protein VIK51_08110 [Vicinamibacteria bacterium]